MKRATFTVLFYLKRTKNKKDGTTSIYARITVNSQRAEFGLQKSIYEKDWNNDKGCMRGYSRAAKQFNSSLDMVKNRLYSHKLEIEELGNEITASNLKEAYLGITKSKKTILEVFGEHSEICKSYKANIRLSQYHKQLPSFFLKISISSFAERKVP